MSAEVVSAYSLKIQAMFPNKIIMPVGCVGSVFGYWPTRKMLKEGGYEVVKFKKKFSLEGDFIEENIEGMLSGSVSRMLSNTNKKY